jgi:hypothetical protein
MMWKFFALQFLRFAVTLMALWYVGKVINGDKEPWSAILAVAFVIGAAALWILSRRKKGERGQNY